MKTSTFTIILLLIFQAVTSWAQKTYPNIGKIIFDNDKLKELISEDAKIEVLAMGFTWSEGPAWVKDGNYLLFSDVPENIIHQWSEKEGLKEFLKPSGYTGRGIYSDEPGSNGLTIDHKGRLIMAEHGDRRISAMPLTGGGKITLADNYDGKRFNSPNDVVQHPTNHQYYFTDPPYGLAGKGQDPTREIDFFGVYRIDPAGKVVMLDKTLKGPNGIAFSPDGKTLYVAQSVRTEAIVKSYPVKSDGNVGEGKLLYDATPLINQGLPGTLDGLKTDIQGNIWTSGPGGVLILDPTGKLLGRIETGTPTSNCAWGDDGSTLYITANNMLCRVKTKTKGSGK